MTDLEELRNDILREMYAEAEPPLDFDKVLANPDEINDNWYHQHYLLSKRQQEIFEKHVDDVSLSDRERADLTITCITSLGPTGNREIMEEARRKT